VVKEEVSPTTEILEKIKPLLEEFKKFIHDELPEGLSLWQHSTPILHDVEDPFRRKRVLEMKVLKFSNSYHLLLAHGRDENMIHH